MEVSGGRWVQAGMKILLMYLLESQSGHVLGHALEVHHGQDAVHVVQDDVLVASAGQHRAAGGQFQCVYLLKSRKMGN